MTIDGRSLRIGALVSPFVFVAVFVMCLNAERRDRHHEAILFGETHISNCFIDRLNRGDLSELTEKRARFELAAMEAREALLKHKVELLHDIERRHFLGDPVPPEEWRLANSGSGGTSCLPGDYEADADFLADSF